MSAFRGRSNFPLVMSAFGGKADSLAHLSERLLIARSGQLSVPVGPASQPHLANIAAAIYGFRDRYATVPRREGPAEDVGDSHHLLHKVRH